MAVKLSVGLQRKVGLPEYGSIGASCHVEFEVDNSLLFNDRREFQEHVREAYAACEQAVNDQLARHQAAQDHRGAAPSVQPANGHAASHERNGYSNGIDRGDESPRRVRLATPSQVRAIRAIAGRGQIDLAEVLGTRFGVARPEDLTLADASALIDELKELQVEGARRRRSR